MSLAGSGLPWYAVRVRSNFERQVHTMLTCTGFDAFLPTYRQRRCWSDRIKELDVPVFPGYMFCRLGPQQRAPLLKTPGVVNVVGIGRTPEPISEEEISAVRLIVERTLTARPWPFLHVGQKVRIHKGPLSGVEGFLVEFKGSFRVVVSVSLLQRSVAAEVDGAWVYGERPASIPAQIPALLH